jgi:hypothetical protein
MGAGLMNVWSASWGSSWGYAWAEAVLPPVATLVLGEIRIRPLLDASVAMKTAIAGDVETGLLLSAKIRTNPL